MGLSGRARNRGYLLFQELQAGTCGRRGSGGAGVQDKASCTGGTTALPTTGSGRQAPAGRPGGRAGRIPARPMWLHRAFPESLSMR